MKITALEALTEIKKCAIYEPQIKEPSIETFAAIIELVDEALGLRVPAHGIDKAT